MTNPLPTKQNLLAARARQVLATSGAALMEKKRELLTRRRTGLAAEAATCRAALTAALSEAHRALRGANIALGQCDRFADAVAVDDSLHLQNRSTMGYTFPVLVSDERGSPLPYDLTDTGSALDEAFLRFTQVKALIRALAEAETTVCRLRRAEKSAQIRVNALEQVVIPDLNRRIRVMAEALEEREREALARIRQFT